MNAHLEDCGCHGDYLCLPHKLAYWRDNGSLQIDPRATPSRRNNNPPKVHTNRNSWERGVPTDGRGMPMLKRDQSGAVVPIGQKEYAENRHVIEQQRRALHAPDPRGNQ